MLFKQGQGPVLLTISTVLWFTSVSLYASKMNVGQVFLHLFAELLTATCFQAICGFPGFGLWLIHEKGSLIISGGRKMTLSKEGSSPVTK